MTLKIGCGKRRSKETTIGIDVDRDSDCDLVANARHLSFKSRVFQ